MALDESILSAALIALAKQSKAQCDALCCLIDEVAALRETVRNLDPLLSDVLVCHEQEQSRAAVRSMILGQFDDMIRRLETSLQIDVMIG